MISCTPYFPFVSMEKACADGICSNTFVCYNNQKKFCSTLCYPSVMLNRPAKTEPWRELLTASLRIRQRLHLLLLLRLPTMNRLITPQLEREGTILGSPHHIRAALPPRCALADPGEILLHPPLFSQHASRLQASMHRFRLFFLHKMGHI